ncbi:MAG: MBL fold metallo-hydrolase [Candidatus Hadarchaeales archaeon]
MRITVFGGAGEIGGNQILLEGKETKILLDFGRSFARESLYFDEPYLSARKPEHLYSLHLLPDIEGIYPWEEIEPSISGIFISHAHLDHMDYIRYVKESIPIYVGEGTWKIITARDATGKSSKYQLAKFNEKLSDSPQRCIVPCRGFTIQPFRTGRELSVDEFKIKPVHVDHSAPAAYGFIIDGPEGRVVYTGDIRFHGYKRSFSEEFLRMAENPDVLITEGTNLVGFKPSSEEEVGRKLGDIIEKTSGLVAASFSPVDIDRMKTFFNVAKRSGRKFIISMKQAMLIDVLSDEIRQRLLDFPFTLGDENVLIYEREKEKTYKWEEKMIERYEVVDSSWVSEHQQEVLLFATYYDMLEMLTIKPEVGSVFIYSESEPWNEEGEFEFEKLENWLETLGMPLVHIHASGHASPFDLKRMIETLSPRKIIMVHSERPEIFKKFANVENMICPQQGVPIEL